MSAQAPGPKQDLADNRRGLSTLEKLAVSGWTILPIPAFLVLLGVDRDRCWTAELWLFLDYILVWALILFLRRRIPPYILVKLWSMCLGKVNSERR